MFTSLCPECGISLNVPEEAALQQCACPKCGAHFIPENNIPDTNKQSTKRYLWKRRYVWGFFYIKFCKIIAIVVTVLFLIWTILKIWDLLTAQNSRKKDIAITAQAIAEQETEFENFYLNTIVQIAGTQQKNFRKSSEDSISGFQLPSQVVSPDIQFNKQLTSVENTQESLKAINEYKNVLNDAEKAIYKELSKNLDSLEKEIIKLDKKIAKNSSKGTLRLNFQRKNHSPALVLKRGSSKKFFSEHRITRIENLLKHLSRNTKSDIISASNQNIQQDMKNLNSYIHYIQQSLLTSQDINVIGGRSGYEKEEPQRVITEDDIRRGILLKYLNGMEKALNEIADVNNWEITRRLEILNTKLEEHQRLLIKEKDRCWFELKNLGKTLFFFWICCTFIILGILVLADFLEAHFDSAENSFRKTR